MSEIERIIAPFNILSKKPLIEAIEDYVIKARIEEQENHATYFSLRDFIREYGTGCIKWVESVNIRRTERIAELKKKLNPNTLGVNNE